jgi:hypothetical protein
MKKVLFTMMAALLICGMSFAQQKARGNAIKLENPQTASSAEKSGWVGNYSSATAMFSDVIEHGEVAILPKNINPSITGQITKVKYCHYLPTGFTNNSFTLKIYDNVTLAGSHADYGEYDVEGFGTPSYQQAVTFSSTGWQEIELTTPYNIPSTNFAIALQSNGTNPFLMGEVDDESLNQYLFTYNNNDTVYYSIPYMTSGLHTISMAVFVDDGGGYTTTYDVEPMFMNSDFSAEIETLEMGETDDLKFLPYAENIGPDAVPVGTNVVSTIVLKVDGEEYTLYEEEGVDEDGLPVGYGYVYNSLAEGYQLTIPNDELLQMIGTAYNFTIEFTCDVEGDANPDNNTAVLSVTILHLNPVENLNANVEGANVTLTWDAPEAGGGTLQGYYIYRDGESIGMKPASTRTFTDSNRPDDEYEYCVVAKYKQGNAEGVCINVTTDGINSIDAENIAVYPNPATDYVKVANAEGAAISVINNIGQVIANISNASADQEINVSAFAKGIYTIRIVNDGNVVTRQFSVNK